MQKSDDLIVCMRMINYFCTQFNAFCCWLIPDRRMHVIIIRYDESWFDYQHY